MVKSAFPSFVFKLIKPLSAIAKLQPVMPISASKRICASLLVHSVPNLPGHYLLDTLIFAKPDESVRDFMNTWENNM